MVIPVPEQPPSTVFTPEEQPQLDNYKSSFISTPEKPREI